MFAYFKIGEELIQVYSLILGAIIVLGFYLSRWLLEKKNQHFKAFSFFYISLVTVSWIGAKALYVFNLDSSEMSSTLFNGNFWLGGGFVFYGGFTFGAIFTLCHGIILKKRIRDYEFLVPMLILCHGLGRLGCLLAGCCYGRTCDLPWAIELHGHLRHPVQLYESILLIILFFIFLKRFLRNKTIILEYIGIYALIRFVLEFFRGDLIRGLHFFGLSTSQIISIMLITLIFILKFIPKKSKSL